MVRFVIQNDIILTAICTFLIGSTVEVLGGDTEWWAFQKYCPKKDSKKSCVDLQITGSGSNNQVFPYFICMPS